MDDDFLECFHFQRYKFQVNDWEFVPSLLPQLQIKFNFNIEFKYTNCNLNQDSRAYDLEDLGSSTLDTSAVITVQNPLSYEQVSESIERVLNSFDISLPGREKLIKLAWEEVNKLVPKHVIHGVLDFDFELTVHHIHVFASHEESRDQCDMVPAADSCVGLLEKYDPENNLPVGSCCICLEHFSGDEGCEILGMPCSHYFHGDCIKKWLSTSHYCPLCRREMPTAA